MPVGAKTEIGGWGSLQGAAEDYQALAGIENLPADDKSLEVASPCSSVHPVLAIFVVPLAQLLRRLRIVQPKVLQRTTRLLLGLKTSRQMIKGLSNGHCGNCLSVSSTPATDFGLRLCASHEYFASKSHHLAPLFILFLQSL
jgi:hypothetical protein